MDESNENAALARWNATIALVRDLSLDRRLTGLASAYAERAALELEKISPQGIVKTTNAGGKRKDCHMSTAIYEKIASTARKVRVDTEATDVDIALSDGTIVRRKGESAATLVALDEIIEFAEALATCHAEAVEVDPKSPSSCCAPQSCDQ